MRKKKPVRALIDQVRIRRDGNDAIIEYADREISDTRLTFGPQIKTMTDSDIVDVFNGIMDAQKKLLRGWNKTVIEVQPGKQQIEYHEDSDQWVPRGDVLRCIIGDGGPDGEVTIHIDKEELSLKEFGWLLRVARGICNRKSKGRNRKPQEIATMKSLPSPAGVRFSQRCIQLSLAETVSVSLLQICPQLIAPRTLRACCPTPASRQ